MLKKLNLFAFIVLVAALNLNLVAQQGTDPGTANLTHSWKFNGSVIDDVGGANGTLMGAAEVYEGSLLTMTNGDYLELPAAQIAINTYDEITIDAWFRSVPNGNTGYTMLAAFGDTKNALGINYYFMCAARGDDKSRAAISCGNESAPYNVESGANGPEYDEGELHQMVSTLTPAEITLYIDGVLQATTPLSATNTIPGISNVHAYIAKSTYDGDATWAGETIQFDMYNKALTADEVLFLFNKGAAPVGIAENKSVPREYRMSQNYPNPFNPTTKIDFTLPRTSNVHLSVINMLGQVVKVLADGEFTAGTHVVTLDASRLSSGVYYYRLQADNFVDVKKLTFVK